MAINKRKKKKLIFWSSFRKINIAGPKNLGLTSKKKTWKRFLFTSAFWKRRAFSLATKNKFPFNLSFLEKSLNFYAIF